MIIKPNLINKALISNTSSFLVFGPNSGKVDDICTQITDFLKKDTEGKLLKLNFSGEQENSDANFIEKEFHSDDLFGTKKIILCPVDANQSMLKKINFDKLPQSANTKLILKGGEIEKKNFLRKTFETGKGLVSLGCYEDSELEKISIFNNLLMNEGIELLNEIQADINFKGDSDRNAIKQKAEKIICFLKGGADNSSLVNLSSILSDFSIVTIEDLVFSVFSGKLHEFEKYYNMVKEQGKNQVSILNYFSRHVQKLILFKNSYSSNKNINQSLRKVVPPVFFKKREEFLFQTKIWKLKKLENIITDFLEIELNLKSKSVRINNSLDKFALLKVCKHAAECKSC